MTKKAYLSLAAVLVLAGCAGHKDVRPGADGIHRVVIQSEDTEQASREAIRQANDFCKERKKEAAFLKEDSKYSGDMDEGTYKNGKRMAKVAKTVGSGVWVFGGKTESAIGGIAGLGGQAADNALGNGYTVDMRFKCM